MRVIGKGITFDSGGISIKPSANMDKMRGDMGGAACTLATILTAARLKLPLHITGYFFYQRKILTPRPTYTFLKA